MACPSTGFLSTPTAPTDDARRSSSNVEGDAVMKMIGTREPLALNTSCISIPDISGICMSQTIHPVSRMASDRRNSPAEENSLTCQPRARIKLLTASSTSSSSSMIDTEGFIDDVFISWQRRASRRCAGSTPVILTILPRHVSEQHTKVSVFQCMSTTDRSAALSCQHDSLGIFTNTKVLDRYAHHLLAPPRTGQLQWITRST
jgi:hypothetical protein